MFLLDTAVSSPQFWEHLKLWDQWLFIKINSAWTNDFLNSVYPWWRDSNTWIPLYLFLGLFVFMNFGWKVWPWVAFFIITIALTDQISANLIKNLVQRTRPCNDENFMINVHTLLGGCSSSFSFPSSHATNHFGMAWFIYLTLKKYFKTWSYLFFFWAATIAYGQVYIGIHYPTDVLGGALLGSLIGVITATVFNKKIGLPELMKISLERS